MNHVFLLFVSRAVSNIRVSSSILVSTRRIIPISLAKISPIVVTYRRDNVWLLVAAFL